MVEGTTIINENKSILNKVQKSVQLITRYPPYVSHILTVPLVLNNDTITIKK